MKTTHYFEEQVLRKRPYILREWVERVISAPEKRIVQSDGRVRLWASIEEFEGRMLRVVLLEDGETVHNAFFDRGYNVSEGET